MDELIRLGLGEAASLIQSRQISPIDLTRACIARAEALEPALNAYLTPTFEGSQ